MRTGDEVHELGLYVSDCCGEEMIFDKNDCFCRCTGCERLCEWGLVEHVVSWNDLEALEQEVA